MNVGKILNASLRDFNLKKKYPPKSFFIRKQLIPKNRDKKKSLDSNSQILVEIIFHKTINQDFNSFLLTSLWS